MSEENPGLQELLDKQACTDLLARYASALEWADEQALSEVFFADAEVDYGFFKGRGDQFVPAMMAQIRACLRTWHGSHDRRDRRRPHGDIAVRRAVLGPA